MTPAHMRNKLFSHLFVVVYNHHLPFQLNVCMEAAYEALCLNMIARAVVECYEFMRKKPITYKITNFFRLFAN
jgi:hypothetical protein